MHMCAPGAARVLVVDPAAQMWHAETPPVEYLPGVHDVQLEAPADARVLVADPAPHAAHAWLDSGENVPGPHAVHVVAPLLTTPVPAPTSAINPAAQAMQLGSVPAAGW